MKQILVMGHYDKTDFMMYLSKLLSMEHRVLLVDASRNKDYEFVFPKMDPTLKVHEHDQFVILEEIHSHSELMLHLENNHYDFVLIDCDNETALKEWPEVDLVYMVTSYENPVIQRNLKLIHSYFQGDKLTANIPVMKVIHEATNHLDEQYINSLMDDLSLSWRESLVYYSDERDQTLKIINQYKNTVMVKRMSSSYKLVIKQAVEFILNTEMSKVNALWKRAERSN
ncbi:MULTISPECIES: hypothetical protein [unclassified Paenibacillus]|uniref:hypothetical protein n=1 Tax=unclassified Paenibacillus TaxID=185978 RepID=UPI0004137283|nr:MULTISPECIES: hypothetical protein [unclassified Paenibacillus]KGP79594.1 hypothetical protein P364_0123725 [Paenibacillus sp. MAEPY2]KGP80434.1 hypothetical protein P363_0130285 [Paenibacillus sp. MAEPY1]